MDFEVLKARFFEAPDRENGGISGAARAVAVNGATAYGCHQLPLAILGAAEHDGRRRAIARELLTALTGGSART
ncbi:hypothetical protein [Actinomadura sp. DC4]|uniref:hypothetical protein n=1 Tax=Actinomadura sp. DC4 TaxID=3055069 RepID=UPI0025B0FA0C|nr:hypothetical protein [Actinomadura sp. DC4]MDN3355178.1 hypothetical protein [Actinomadura sp. DC4]